MTRRRAMKKDEPATIDQQVGIVGELSHIAEDVQLPVIGRSIWWSLREGDRTYNEMEAAVAHIGKSFFPRKPLNKRALRLALEQLEADGLVRKVRDDKTASVYVLVREIRDEANDDLDLEKLSRVLYDKANQKLEFRLNYREADIRTLFEHYQEVFTTDDITRVIINFINYNGGVAMRETGGIYFMPNPNSVTQLKGFVRAMGCSFYSFPIYKSIESQTEMGLIVKDRLQVELHILTTEVEKLIAAERTRDATFQTKLEQFKSTRAKYVAYTDLLKLNVEDLDAQLTQVEAQVRKALVDGAAKYPQANEFPIGAEVTYGGRAVNTYGTKGTVIGYALTDGTPYVKVKFANGKVGIVTVSTLDTAQPTAEAI